MKTIVKKYLTPDEYVAGPLIHWSNNIQETIQNLWSNIELRNPRFYQLTYKFDRPAACNDDYIVEFFAKRDVFAVVRNYSDPKIGDRSWLFLMALPNRFSKYKTPRYF